MQGEKRGDCQKDCRWFYNEKVAKQKVRALAGLKMPTRDGTRCLLALHSPLGRSHVVSTCGTSWAVVLIATVRGTGYTSGFWVPCTALSNSSCCRGAVF